MKNNNTVEACTHCHVCQNQCEFLKKYGIDIGDTEKLKELSYHCFLCGKCTEVCPENIDGREYILNLRREKVEKSGGTLEEKGYGMLLKEKKEYWAAQESDITGVIPQEVSFEDEEVYKEVHKVLCMGDKADIAALEQQLVKEFPQIRIYRSKDTYLEIMSMKASKSDAIHMLKEHFHVKQEETMAFGDNFNDIDMIRYAGLGVAMGNATDEVKEAADIITDINDNEGERQILDKYFK